VREKRKKGVREDSTGAGERLRRFIDSHRCGESCRTDERLKRSKETNIRKGAEELLTHSEKRPGKGREENRGPNPRPKKFIEFPLKGKCLHESVKGTVLVHKSPTRAEPISGVQLSGSLKEEKE